MNSVNLSYHQIYKGSLNSTFEIKCSKCQVHIFTTSTNYDDTPTLGNEFNVSIIAPSLRTSVVTMTTQLNVA